jgi:hypothetical protein
MTTQQIVPNNAIAATQAWVQSVVVGLNFCPFAAKEVASKRIRYHLSNALDLESSLETLAAECELLDQDPETETTLLIFTEGFDEFYPFLDLVDLANQLIEKQGYEGVYQLASFHPDYCFADVQSDDPSNYTNRSPYPMLHIIREQSLERALEKTSNPEQIPERNIQLARELGTDKLQQLLDACRRPET